MKFIIMQFYPSCCSFLTLRNTLSVRKFHTHTKQQARFSYKTTVSANPRLSDLLGEESWIGKACSIDDRCESGKTTAPRQF
jgi:hypothetical protein